CADKLILETILQDKFFYFKAEEGGVAVTTATDDNAEIRNLDARLFEKSTCWHTSNKRRETNNGYYSGNHTGIEGGEMAGRSRSQIN
ncbi:hypothetical protein, partial [Blautia wexlerae]|uniref:hypothetical protein n=2 Tax=Blautia wexlerae TaxID=418240 RepID=UPI0034A47F10